MMNQEYKIVQKNRLMYYKNEDFSWDNHWGNTTNFSNIFIQNDSNLGYLDFIKMYLPRTGKILEAGCGSGIYVHKLLNNGYNCEGVDYASETINNIKRVKPELPVRVANLLDLECKDETYSGLVSLGVIEHRVEGPEPFLAESFRVLQKNGIAIFTVPHFSMLRKIKNYFRMYPSKASGKFYQYAFSKNEIIQIIKNTGFTIRAVHYYDAWKGLKDEIPFFAHLHSKANVASYANTINKQKWLLPYTAHMIAIVCEKKSSVSTGV